MSMTQVKVKKRTGRMEFKNTIDQQWILVIKD